MKKLSFLIIFIPLFIQAKKPVQSEITDVIVYQNGAKITNRANISLSAGTHEIAIRGIPVNIDQNSVQAQLLGDVVLLSATSRNVTLENEDIPKRTKILEDSLNYLKRRVQWLKSEKSVYNGEQQLIIANQKLGSNEEKVSVDEIIKLSNFFRTRITEIKKKIYKIDIQLAELSKEIAKITKKLQDLSYSEKKTVGEVVLSISAKKAVTTKLRLSYLTYQAGWSPIYDIRVGKADEPVNLVYKANVRQSTGLNWENVDLTISTGNPRANNNRPILNPWFIDFAKPILYEHDKYKKRTPSAAQNIYQRSMVKEVEAEDIMFDEAAAVGYGVQLQTNKISAQYVIDIPQNIPSDNQLHLVAMKEYDLGSKFMYHSVPKLDRGAFLIAKIADYGKYNLIAGPANLFYEGMYIGQSNLNPVTTVDSMLLSLGRDEKIIVKRNQLTDLTASQTVGNNVKETKAYEISVRNNNNFPIELDLMDQIPIAQDKEIEVKLTETGDAKYDEAYGSLLWKLDIKPGATKKVKFVYIVKYPKGKQIHGL